ncbi:putative repeat protein (TIGR02059 family) [Marinoscillum furvescens DSM 4134]|uniref:Putative repeat protein (TIGR02059 family) n=2 Tax=Marinoscillum furvescens TaxID=1026 RepID=A0A3D9L5K3_MARFU|nr:putative repeat protein (TIGR02059 family) [Marinoscillum furvescens DSM 4134]
MSRVYVMGMLFIGAATSCDDKEDALPELKADFTASVSQITAGDEVTFTSSVEGEGDAYLWTFEGGTPASSTEANPKVTYATAGKFDVTLEVTRTADEASVTTKKEEFITVDEPLSVTAAFTADMQEIEQGQSITFTNTTTSNGSGATLEWVFEGGTPETSTDAEVTVTYAAAGTYDVMLIASEEDVVDTLSKTDFVTVSALNASFDMSAASVFKGESVTFTSTSTAGATLSWAFEGGTPATSTDSEVTVAYETVGIYDVTLVVTKNGIAVTETKVDAIEVKELQAAAFVSAKLATDGASISLTYDKELNDPSGEVAAFTVKVNGTASQVSSVSLADGDAKTLVVSLATAITAGQTISVSYTPGITAKDGAAVSALTDQSVTNSLGGGGSTDGNLVTNFDLDFETVSDISTVFTEFGGDKPTGATRAVSDAQASVGSKSVHVMVPADGNAVITTLTSSSAFTLDASKTYTFSFDVYTVSQGAEFTVRVQPLSGWAENKIWTGPAAMKIEEWNKREWDVSGADIAEGKFHIQFISKVDAACEYYLDNFIIKEK